MHIPIAALIGALTVPFVLWLLWMRSEKLVFRGQAQVLPYTRFIGSGERNAFAVIAVPTVGEIVSDIDVKRARSFDGVYTPITVEISVTRRVLAKPQIDSITWSDGKVEATGSKRFDGLFLAGYYLILGLLCLTVAGWASATALIVSGFVTGNKLQSESKLEDAGRGQLIGLSLMTVLLGLGSVVLFQTPSFFMFFPGIPVAFGFGQLCGLLARTRWQAEQA